MKLSLIIVNYKSLAFLRECLVSVYGCSRGLEFEIIVVDCGSGDGCGAMLERVFPKVRFIQEQNIGFSRANNRAADCARGEYLLFLNPDTLVGDTVLQRMVSIAESIPDLGAATCRVLNRDGTLQTSCVLAFPTVSNEIWNADFVRNGLQRLKIGKAATLFDTKHDSVEVDAVTGACMLIRAELFRALRGFSEDYFMYSEDVDLCYRAVLSGRRNRVFPGISIVHFGGQSSKQHSDYFGDVMVFEARYKFLRAHRGGRYAAVYRCVMLLMASLRCVLMGCAVGISRSLRRGPIWYVESRFEKWRSVLRWTMGKEKWVTSLQ